VIVTVRLYATLRDLTPDRKGVVELSLPDGSTVAVMIARLGIPPGVVRKVFVGGIAQEESHVLQPGDEVGVFPPIAGGAPGMMAARRTLTMKLKKGVRQMVDEAKARITTLSLEEARARHGKDDVVFVDLRDVRELERDGMIPGAYHCPRGMLEFWIDPESPYHKEIFASGKEFVFYCNLAGRSALAADVARQMGLERVCEMGGGFTAWQRAGFPVAERPRRRPA